MQCKHWSKCLLFSMCFPLQVILWCVSERICFEGSVAFWQRIAKLLSFRWSGRESTSCFNLVDQRGMCSIRVKLKGGVEVYQAIVCCHIATWMGWLALHWVSRVESAYWKTIFLFTISNPEIVSTNAILTLQPRRQDSSESKFHHWFSSKKSQFI